MTEEEAKTKWCPIIGLGGAILNIQGGQRECIGSACMMWRWQVSEHQAAEINARGNAGAMPSGHCGLAGKP